LVLFAVLLAWNAELRIAALRLFLVPVHYTQLAVAPGDQKLKVGSDFTIEATLSGRPVRSAELYYRAVDADEDWTALSLAPPDLASAKSPKLLGTLTTTLKDCRQNLEYRVVAGPLESPRYRLTILHPLVLKKIEATVEPPAYTRKPTAVQKEGN